MTSDQVFPNHAALDEERQYLARVAAHYASRAVSPFTEYEYDATGQTDPCGWPLRVTWSADDGLAHAEPAPNEYPAAADCAADLAALVARIDGQYFTSAAELRAFLRHQAGTRDFD